ELRVNKEKDSVNSTNRVNAVSSIVNAASNEVNAVGIKSRIKLLDEPNMPELEDVSMFEDSNEDVFWNKLDERGIVIRNKARIEAIRLLLAYASFKDFVVYQMDVKSAFIYGKIEEEVYVFQPLGFEDPDFPNKVYNVEKALYGLHQSLRAWCFGSKINCWIMDITLCRLRFILIMRTTETVKNINGEAQLHAKVDGKKVVISEASIRRDLRFGDEGGIDYLPNETIFEQLTLMGFVQVFLNNQLEEMDNHTRIYASPSHTKKIFRNIKRVGKGFSRKDTPLFPTMMVQAQKELGEDIVIPTESYPTPIITQLSSQPSWKQKPSKTKRQDTKLPQTSVPTETVANEAINEEMYDSLERATTTATSLDAEQDRGNISKTQSKATPNEPSSLETSSGGSPRRQDTIGDTIAQARSKNVSNFSNYPPFSRVNTLGSGEDRVKLKELMKLYTKLFDRVLNLETTKTTQAKKISRLKKRVKRLEKKNKPRTHALKRLYKVGLSARVKSSDEESLEDQGRINNEEMFDTNVLNDAKIFAESVDVKEQAKEIVYDKDLIDDITLAKALMEIKVTAADTRPKAKSIVMQEPNQISFDEQEAKRLQFEINEQDRLAEEKAQQIKDENLAWDNVQAMIDADYEFTAREDLEVLWRLVKDIFVKTEPVDDMDSFLLHTLKTTFEHHVEDTVWKSQQGLTKIGKEIAKGRMQSLMKCLDESS
nr:hypothetical protein [Tanacetum cinerariifolium]